MLYPIFLFLLVILSHSISLTHHTHSLLSIGFIPAEAPNPENSRVDGCGNNTVKRIHYPAVQNNETSGGLEASEAGGGYGPLAATGSNVCNRSFRSVRYPYIAVPPIDPSETNGGSEVFNDTDMVLGSRGLKLRVPKEERMCERKCEGNNQLQLMSGAAKKVQNQPKSDGKDLLQLMYETSGRQFLKNFMRLLTGTDATRSLNKLVLQSYRSVYDELKKKASASDFQCVVTPLLASILPPDNEVTQLHPSAASALFIGVDGYDVYDKCSFSIPRMSSDLVLKLVVVLMHKR
eukprot:GHVQ01030127.1.p1 GENE.GHVQ01030127.1~~GHVQ01030127.1.p1  ORF type:complete len:323 (-),score=31.45 GHVQ01030127.1:923-1795(-)